MSWSSPKKKRAFFVPFLTFVFISVCSRLNTLSEYIFFYISKRLLYILLLLVFKIVENLQYILKISINTYLAEQNSEPSQIFKMKLFARIVIPFLPIQ